MQRVRQKFTVGLFFPLMMTTKQYFWPKNQFVNQIRTRWMQRNTPTIFGNMIYKYSIRKIYTPQFFYLLSNVLHCDTYNIIYIFIFKVSPNKHFRVKFKCFCFEMAIKCVSKGYCTFQNLQKMDTPYGHFNPNWFDIFFKTKNWYIYYCMCPNAQQMLFLIY